MKRFAGLLLTALVLSGPIGTHAQVAEKPQAEARPALTLADLVGTYERHPVDSFIFTGTLVQRGDRLHWTFGWDPDDGKGFDLIPDLENLRLIPDENAMAYYINRGPRQFSLIITDGQVEGFTYNEITYTKRGFVKARPDVRFVDHGDGTVTDQFSGLVWLKDANCADLVPPDHFEENFAFTRTDALEAVRNLRDGMCGLTDGSKPGDWRLPTAAEFCGGWQDQAVGFCAGEGGLVDTRFRNPALSNAKGDSSWTEGNVFTNVYHGDEKGYHTATPPIPPDSTREPPYGNEHVWRVFLSWQGKWGGNGAWTLSFFPDARVWPVRDASGQ